MNKENNKRIWNTGGPLFTQLSVIHNLYVDVLEEKEEKHTESEKERLPTVERCNENIEWAKKKIKELEELREKQNDQRRD